MFPALCFKPRKLEKVTLCQCLLTELLQSSLKEKSTSISISALFLKLCGLQVRFNFWMSINQLFKHSSAVLLLPKSLFKSQIGIKCLLSWSPGHPTLEDIPRPLIVSQDLLHVGILVPELIDPGMQLASAFPHVSSMIDEFVSHLHLGVFQPQADVLVVSLDGPFKNGPRSPKLLEFSFPEGVFYPVSSELHLVSYRRLKLGSHALLVVL